MVLKVIIHKKEQKRDWHREEDCTGVHSEVWDAGLGESGAK